MHCLLELKCNYLTEIHVNIISSSLPGWLQNCSNKAVKFLSPNLRPTNQVLIWVSEPEHNKGKKYFLSSLWAAVKHKNTVFQVTSLRSRRAAAVTV